MRCRKASLRRGLIKFIRESLRPGGRWKSEKLVFKRGGGDSEGKGKFVPAVILPGIKSLKVM